MPDPNHSSQTGHVSRGTLYVTFVVLLVLLAATVAVGLYLSGRMGTVMGLGISVIKTVLIAVIFMNLRYASGLVRLASVAAGLWLVIAVMLVLGDYESRGWNETHEPFLQHATDIESYDRVFYLPAEADSSRSIGPAPQR